MAEQDFVFNVDDVEMDLFSDEVFNPTNPKQNTNVYTPAEKSQVNPTELSEEQLLSDDDIKIGVPKDKDKQPDPNNPEENQDENKDDDANEEQISLTEETFQKLADDLVTMGILIPDGEEEKIVVKTPEEFQQQFQKSYQKGAIAHISNVVGQYGPEYAEAWNIIFEQGLNPYEYFTRQKQIDDLAEIDLEDKDNCKYVYKTFLEKQGLAPATVEKKLQQSIDLDNIKEDATEAQGILVNAENKAKLEAAARVERQRKQEEAAHYEFASSVHNLLSGKLKEKEYDGIPFTQKDVDIATDFLYTKRHQLPTGELLTTADVWWLELKKNPALAAKFALMASVNFDVSRIQKKGVSKKNDQLFNNLIQQNKVVERNAPKQKESRGFFDD